MNQAIPAEFGTLTHWPDGRERLTLTEADAQADLNGTRRPDNHVG